MVKIVAVIAAAAVAAAAAGAYKIGLIFNPSPSEPPAETSIFEFAMKDIDGRDVKLDAYSGKVIMIVNVASKCGYTPQYEGLQALYKKYKDQGFVVLGFPANNFMGQEPGTEAEIKEFCSLKYNVSFPMFSKISVKGEDQHPLYTFLTNPKSNPDFSGEITWNFNKFILDRKGKISGRFATKEDPQSEAVTAAIEKLLSQK